MAPRRASGLGDLVAVEAVDAAAVGEEQKRIVRGGDVHLLHEVLLAGGRADHALAAALLGAVGVLGQALDVAVVRQRHHHVLLLNEVEHVDLAVEGGDLRAALVGKARLDLEQFIPDDAQQDALVGKYLFVPGDLLLQFGVFLLGLFAFQTGELGKAHVEDGLRLPLGEAEALHEAVLGLLLRARGAQKGDDLVDVIEGDEQAFEDVAAGLGLVEVVLRAPRHHVALMVEVVADDLVQRERARLAVHQRDHDGAKGVLQLRVLVEVVEHHIGVDIAL